MDSTTVQEIMNKIKVSKDSEYSDSESEESVKLEGGDKVLNKIDGRRDPLFFEFFSIYTAQSVKQTSRH